MKEKTIIAVRVPIKFRGELFEFKDRRKANEFQRWCMRMGIETAISPPDKNKKKRGED